jgi:hypothetical protein
MSTKNLSRTVIEGGRYRPNSWARRSSNGLQRAAERAVLGPLTRALELDDVTMPKRKKVRRDFADKLGPPKRWLASQVGRPWDRVRAELLAKFDTRTTAGRHIVFDHMLPSVEGRGWPWDRPDFIVDRRGILRRARR